MENATRILQIIPAPNWQAAYQAAYKDGPCTLTKPLVCWALVERADGQRHVIGMTARGPNGSVIEAPATDNFTGYVQRR